MESSSEGLSVPLQSPLDRLDGMDKSGMGRRKSVFARRWAGPLRTIEWRMSVSKACGLLGYKS